MLTGARVSLKVLDAADAEACARYAVENAEHLRRWHPGDLERQKHVEYWRERFSTPAPRKLAFGIFANDDPSSLAGDIGLQEITGRPLCSSMLGYSIAAKNEGRGFMSEAIALVIAHAFGPLNLHKLYASFDVENARSKKLLERAGFRHEGRLYAHLLVGGAWRDLDQMSLINPAWRP